MLTLKISPAFLSPLHMLWRSQGHHCCFWTLSLRWNAALLSISEKSIGENAVSLVNVPQHICISVTQTSQTSFEDTFKMAAIVNSCCLFYQRRRAQAPFASLRLQG